MRYVQAKHVDNADARRLASPAFQSGDIVFLDTRNMQAGRRERWPLCRGAPGRPRGAPMAQTPSKPPVPDLQPTGSRKTPVFSLWSTGQKPGPKKACISFAVYRSETRNLQALRMAPCEVSTGGPLSIATRSLCEIIACVWTGSIQRLISFYI